MEISLHAINQDNSAEAFKAKAERQNFTIQQNIGKNAEINVWNKQIGKNYGSGRYAPNVID